MANLRCGGTVLRTAQSNSRTGVPVPSAMLEVLLQPLPFTCLPFAFFDSGSVKPALFPELSDACPFSDDAFLARFASNIDACMARRMSACSCSSIAAIDVNCSDCVARRAAVRFGRPSSLPACEPFTSLLLPVLHDSTGLTTRLGVLLL